MRARVFPRVFAEVFMNIWHTATPCDGERMGMLAFDTVTWYSSPT